MSKFVVRLFLGGLILTMFTPYVAFFKIADQGLRCTLVTIALSSLYEAGLIIPLVTKKLGTILALWIYIFTLVGIPIGSDMTVHIIGITPDRYLSFLQTWALIVMPAYIVFLAMLFIHKGYR